MQIAGLFITLHNQSRQKSGNKKLIYTHFLSLVDPLLPDDKFSEWPQGMNKQAFTNTQAFVSSGTAVGVIERPLWTGNAVQPMVFAANVDARLIGMYDVRLQ